MRLPNTAHTSRPWRIHELTHDFRLEDVWALPTPGGPDDFPRLVHLIASSDLSQGSSRAARMLSAIRWKLGELLGWDDADAGLGSRVPTLRDRLPVDLRDAPSGPEFAALPFTSLYLLDDEWAAEIANRTMHGFMHIGWVPDQTAGYRAPMAVLVKPNGLIGAADIAAMRQFWLFRRDRLLSADDGGHLRSRGPRARRRSRPARPRCLADGGDDRRQHPGRRRPDRRRPGVSAHPVGTARRDRRRIRERRPVHIRARAAHVGHVLPGFWTLSDSFVSEPHTHVNWFSWVTAVLEIITGIVFGTAGARALRAAE